MRTLVNSFQRPAHDSFIEKKSEFIGDACHIRSLDEAVSFVETIRLMHPKARHVAYAAVCAESFSQLCERMSDDGEPSGTAGKPILNVIRSAQLTNCVICVTRYFGGILLGSGGLIRAYAKGASLAIRAASLAEIQSCTRFNCELAYQQLRMFQYLLQCVEGNIEQEEYSQHVRCEVIIPDHQVEHFLRSMRETFSGNILVDSKGACVRIVG